MRIEDLIDYLYEIYSKSGYDGDIKVKRSFYSCGATHEVDLSPEEIEFSDGRVLIRGEDN